MNNISYLHRSTEEKEELQKRIDNCLTKLPLTPNDMVKADDYALSLFYEYANLLEKLGRADALFNSTLNRFALKSSEFRQITLQKEKVMELMESCEDDIKTYNALLKSYNELVKLSNTISQLLLNMEKELSITVNTTQRCKIPIPNQEENDFNINDYILHEEE